jgi:flagellar motility protein MotE (MotC chaperone)
MIKLARDFRLIPLVLLATICLFTLKVSGLVFDGGYTLGERLKNRATGGDELKITSRDSIPAVTPIIVGDRKPAESRLSWAQDMFNYGGDVTGSVGGTKKETKPDPAKGEGKDSGKDAAKADGKDTKEAKVKPAAPPADPGGLVIPPNMDKLAPKGERAILERLQERRTELDSRDRDLEMRENLIKAAEKRLAAHVAELKEVEKRITAAHEARDEEEAKRFKGIVAMYENMKPKDAARIFDRLDMKVLVEVSTQLKPRTMSEIMAAMSAEAAERLTVELASRARAEKAKGQDTLPKIESTSGS